MIHSLHTTCICMFGKLRQCLFILHIHVLHTTVYYPYMYDIIRSRDSQSGTTQHNATHPRQSHFQFCLTILRWVCSCSPLSYFAFIGEWEHASLVVRRAGTILCISYGTHEARGTAQELCTNVKLIESLIVAKSHLRSQ